MTSPWSYPGAWPWSPPSWAPVAEPEPGAVVVSSRGGSYEVRRRLGAGASGAVFECVGPFDQLYAIKLLRPANRPYDEVRGEWAREVERFFALRHPNVVYLHDAFEFQNRFYIALERCDHSLADMLGQPLGEGLTLELARQILAAVQYFHDAGLVHGDIYPNNVLVVQADRPIVKLSDFGISNELRGFFAVRPQVVHHAIMAPEVVTSGYTTRQSDIYQVGLVLYWMLTGTPAIDLAAPYAEIVHKVASGEPRRLAEEVRTPLGRVIAKMLRRREEYRYGSAREVWQDLRALPAWQDRNRRLFPLR